MMSPDNNPPACSSKEEPNSNSNTKKPNSNSSISRPQQDQQALKCPRCDSPNTKFCYYNNYSLTQPRHFCKTCRRYWTNGGALRNVPIGGGCRKNKKLKSSSSSSSRLSSSSADSTSDIPGLKFFHGVSPAVDFQLGGLSFPRITPSPPGIYNNISNSYADASNNALPCFALDPSGTSGSFMGFNYPLSSGFGVGAPETAGSMNANSSLALSIESLSSINQDLHLKLQQQRLAMLFGGETQKENIAVSSGGFENPVQKPQPILFQNLEASKPDASVDGNSRKNNGGGGEIATEWFFGNSYGGAAAPRSSNNDGSEGGGNWNNWGDLQHQYNALP